MKIIEPGKEEKYSCECIHCGCKFEVEHMDFVYGFAEKEIEHYNEVTVRLKTSCPWCGEEIECSI